MTGKDALTVTDLGQEIRRVVNLLASDLKPGVFRHALPDICKLHVVWSVEPDTTDGVVANHFRSTVGVSCRCQQFLGFSNVVLVILSIGSELFATRVEPPPRGLVSGL